MTSGKDLRCCGRKLPPSFPLPHTCHLALHTHPHTYLPRCFGSQFVSWTWEQTGQEAAWACLQAATAAHCQTAIQLQLGAQGQLLRWPEGRKAEV